MHNRKQSQEPLPPRFVVESEWYFQKGDRSLEHLKPSKKQVKAFFNLNAKEMDTYLKSNKNALKIEEGLKQLVIFTDTSG